MHLVMPRLELRAFGDEDYESSFLIQGQPDAIKYLHGTSDRGTSDARLRATKVRLYQNGFGILAVVDRQTQRVIGYGGLEPSDVFTIGGDLGVVLAIREDAQGKGFGAEAFLALLRWGFQELARARLLGVVRADNHKSIGLLKRFGAVKIADRPVEPAEIVFEIRPD